MALRGWYKLSPRVSWSPMTWNLSCVIAVQLARLGRLDMAIGVVLSFDCLLRIGELCGLHVDDVGGLESKGVQGEHDDVALRLAKTKTGDNKAVKVRKPETKRLLALWLKRRQKGQKLFGFTAADLRKAFRRACVSVGLDSSYVPHSLRHGGASELFELTGDLHLVMIVGRWAVESSARTYIQDARAILLAKDIPPLTVKLGKEIAKDLIRALSLAVARR